MRQAYLKRVNIIMMNEMRRLIETVELGEGDMTQQDINLLNLQTGQSTFRGIGLNDWMALVRSRHGEIVKFEEVGWGSEGDYFSANDIMTGRPLGEWTQVPGIPSEGTVFEKI